MIKGHKEKKLKIYYCLNTNISSKWIKKKNQQLKAGKIKF